MNNKLVGLIILCVVTASFDLYAEEKPRVSVVLTTSEIKIDGLLNEETWNSQNFIETLTQVEPHAGKQPSQNTTIRILANRQSLFFGIECKDSALPVTFSKQRDADLIDQDHIRMVIDPFQDGRSGYIFAINPSGARYDALVTPGGETENPNWDGIWDAATHISENGWSLEIQIPIETLSYKKGLTSWYFNIQRRIQRLQEVDRWASASPDYEIGQTSRAGLLDRIPNFDLGLGLSIRPAGIAGGGVPELNADTEYTSDASLDVFQKIGSNLLGSLTINTDFAETEVDTRRTNLTRFPLFFPEKRTFFLEGADIFDFGLGLDERILPFFSRRIGLVEGQEVPLNVGTKLNGRVGRTNLGFLAVHTGEEDEVAPDTNLGVLRVKQNIFAESSAGFIATLGDPIGRDGSWLGGADFTYQTSRFRGNKNFLVGVWGLFTDRSDIPDPQKALGLKIDYPNDLWDIAFKYKWIDDQFDPSLGFVQRQGVQISELGITYAPRPGWKYVRQMFNEFFVEYITDLHNEWENYSVFLAPINWQLESGDRFEFNIVPEGENLEEPFEIADDVTIQPDRYHWRRYRLEFEAASKRRLAGEVTWWFGSFYDGTLDQYIALITWNPTPLLTFEFNSEFNDAELSAGDFNQQLYGTRVRVNFSPDIQLSSFLQYDSESNSFGTNTRFRWTFHPQGDLFIVYNHNLLDLQNRWVKDSNELLVKLQYTFRM
ncbi:MAG TPA: DUF5916 domain-containing protein [Acidobacteriota bacterium]|nr:DUF5916 domain-containing protein [Acidobacteriota bacterium]